MCTAVALDEQLANRLPSQLCVTDMLLSDDAPRAFASGHALVDYIQDRLRAS